MNWVNREWFDSLNDRERAQIVARIDNIEDYGHFGDSKYLGEKLYELRWQNGRRIYFGRFEGFVILLLIGGLKNAQEKDIKKAFSPRSPR